MILAGLLSAQHNGLQGNYNARNDEIRVATVSFRLLYGLLIMSHGRRQILWLGVTAQPTAEWIANQLTAACGWEQIPRDLIRDRDARMIANAERANATNE